ncbi:MAG: filamentous hemagglutinin family protein [Opitutaceae bacterium]|nr:filamentous hemagglutinin family protein [Opitutaceae bacterium]
MRGIWRAIASGPGVDASIAGSGEPGTLTLRTSGDLVFDSFYTSSTKKWTLGSLSDGFTGGRADRGGLVDQVLLPAGARSWSYRLVAGADFGAADFRAVAGSAGAMGSIVIGSGSPALPTSGTNDSRYSISGKNDMIPARYQTIRTGTGDITLAAAYDVRLLNNVATIYTAGQQASALAGFDVPKLGYSSLPSMKPVKFGFSQYPSPVQYSMAGGNVSVQAGHDIGHFAETKVGVETKLVADSSKQMPGNWLYRRGLVDPETGQFVVREDSAAGEAMSTTWWIDYSNFYEGGAALGGGNVSLVAGNDILNVDAAVATNARMPGRDRAGAAAKPDASALVELGGGDLTVRAGGDLLDRDGGNLDGGVYYVERGRGTLVAGGEIRTNQTRSTVLPVDVKPGQAGDKSKYESTWLPTTLFLGKGSFDLTAGGDLLFGPVANPFLLPSGSNNGFYNRTFFSTAAPDNALQAASLFGDITLRNSGASGAGTLEKWFDNVSIYIESPSTSLHTYANRLPWLRLNYGNNAGTLFKTAAALMPSGLRATAFSGDIALVGKANLRPSPSGHLELAAAGSLNGFQVNDDPSTPLREWASSSLNFSDADPARFPSIVTPLGGAGSAPTDSVYVPLDTNFLRAFDSLLNETGSTKGSLQNKQALHASDLLHGASTEPVRIYAVDGDITGITLYLAKQTKVIAGNDITDVALYIQNNNSSDVSVVSAGRDIVAFNPNSAARSQALDSGGLFSGISIPGPTSDAPTAGDIQISGPGAIEVLAGRHLDLGIGPNVGDGTGLGLTSVGNARNLALPDEGAAILALAGLGYKYALQGDQADFTAASDALLNPTKTGSPAARFLPALGELMGLGSAADSAVWSAFSALPEGEQRRLAGALMDATHLGAANGLAQSALDFDAFTTAFLDPTSAGAQAARYLPVLGRAMGLASTENAQIWAAYTDPKLSAERRAQLALGVFFTVLRDAGRDYNDPQSPVYRDKEYANGYAAIALLFPGKLWQGDIALTSREIKTFSGGDIGLFAPGGGLTVGLDVSGAQALDQGILTERGGGISIFTHGSVIVGTSRIFTLRGGAEIIWSSVGDIAAGSSSKTVQSAPPTRVLIDPTSADVKTDLSGLATGGGIGVLATRKDVKPDSVDLIAPAGAIDAGDAGIRSSGNLNIAALTIVNAANIATGGSSAGVPAATAPSLGGVAAAATNSTTGTNKTTVGGDSSTPTRETMRPQDLPSLIEVVVTGYGGKAEDEDKDESEKEGDSDSAKAAPAAEEAAAPATPAG